MLRNDFKLAWRNLLKNRFFSLINILGLATGLACFILITLYVTDELSYDRYNEKASRIYRVNSDIIFGTTELKLAVSSDPMGATLKKDYPQVEEFARLYTSSGSKLIKKGNVFINEGNVGHADSTFFRVFTVPAISGNTNTALNEPNTVVVTKSAALKYFGTTDVIGKTIETNDNNGTLYKITAVVKDIPTNSHFHFDFIFSMDNVDYNFGNYLSHNFQTYLLLKEGTDPKEFDKKFIEFTDRYVLPQAKQFMQVNSMEEFRQAGNKLEYHLMPLTDIHLRSDRVAEISVNGNIQYVYIFSAVALFILLIACINFMNLSTARSANRAKEVGIRKVLGTERKTLIRQFLTESTTVALLSLLLAIGIALLALPYFNRISGKEMSWTLMTTTGFLLLLVILPVVIGLLAGIYPSFYLSAFKPIMVLKGKINAGAKRSTLRSVLVIFQFATSIILIVGTIIVYRQLNYIQNKKIGFNKEQVLLIEGTGALGNNNQAFRNEVMRIAGVKSVATGGFLPVSNSSRNDNTFSKEAVMDSKNGFNMQVWRIDENYIPLMGMEMAMGRNFSKEFKTDSSAVIINETTASILGYDNPVGKKIYTSDVNDPAQSIEYNIVGVVKNFNFESMKQQIGALCFRLGDAYWETAFKVDPANMKQLVSQVEKEWTKLAPSYPFSYKFLDESFNNMYRAEQRAGQVALSFSVLAIVIACLGLFGLASFMAEQRTKEIGVRKVLGASMNNIVSMLSRDFLRLVLVSAVFAIPLSWFIMHRWLENFAYRVNISWWVFLLAAILAVVIALLTISFQTVKAALTNPVDSLRSE
ncbi:ABC transporter permease [Flavihumibacter solisilvae]|uniref:Cell division protein FtsX n=1 Tax=Flavihumibacter solisilvae TaxID=1349421 RepID=A0A0C1L214_9BACT|nr:ABC transporter permease [Flavihumibacter solisilvae]KIC93641.1 cell division protein FtsX [Flavihumibacter solisilvae]